MSSNNGTKIKHLEDEVLELRKKLQQTAQFQQEKSSMLGAMALFVDRLGGTVTIGPEDQIFLQGWMNNQILLRVGQKAPYTIFTVVRQEEPSDQTNTGDAVQPDGQPPAVPDGH